MGPAAGGGLQFPFAMGDGIGRLHSLARRLAGLAFPIHGVGGSPDRLTEPGELAPHAILVL